MDGNGLKLEKIGQFFQALTLRVPKILKKLPRVTTTTYGLHSFRYAATQVWNMLPDDIRTSESLIAFKRAIQDITV